MPGRNDTFRHANHTCRRPSLLGFAACFVLGLLCGTFVFVSNSVRADDGEKPVVRPNFSGWHNWKYNKFSSYDQLRLTLDREFAKGQKFLVSVNGLRYQEDDNKAWNTWVGEAYYKFKRGPFDVKFGQLVETLGSGDKVSFVDKLNSRRYYAGLANDYNRDKKEVPCFKTTYYINKRMSFDVHYLPVFQASELPSIYSKWASEFQKSLAVSILKGGTLAQEDETSLEPQYHLAFNSSFKKYELRYHYFSFKERLPIIDQVNEGSFNQMYPLDETWAVDGNITFSKEFLMRFELAYTRNKRFSAFQSARIGRAFASDMYNMLLGTDKTYRNNLYLNVQTLISKVAKLPSKTPFQLAETEYAATLQLRKGFKSERLFIEFNGVNNFTTGEYLLTPNISYQSSDYFKALAGVHLNGRSTYALGPIGQFNKNSTLFLETQVSF